MNNFVFTQDPILYNSTVPQYNTTSEQDLKKQIDTIVNQYQNMQQLPPPQPPQPNYTPYSSTREDYVGNLDNMLKDLSPQVLNILSSNSEFIQINNELQSIIQAEIINSIKNTLNQNTDIISGVIRLKEIIKEAKYLQEAEDRKSMNELNDYIQNYSDMTFNEYKQFKLSKQNQ